MRYAVIIIINYFGKNFFSNYEKKGVNDCFKTVVSSVFTTIASRSKSEQKKRKNKSFDTYHKS